MNKNKEFMLECKLTITLTEDDIDQIMCSALEGGITYWCDTVQVIGDYLGEYAHEQIARGGQLILHDMEDNRNHILTLDKLLDGIKRYIANEYDFGRILESSGRIDPCQIDGAVADCIVQYAIFEECIYV